MDKYPKVMIECPHLVVVQLGEQMSCSMCGAAWGGSPYPSNWEQRLQRAAEYDKEWREREARKANRWYRRLWRWITKKSLHPMI